MLGPQHAFLSYLLVEVPCLVNCLLQPLEGGRLRQVDPLVAGGAHSELETNRHRVGVWGRPEARILLVPPGCNSSVEAILMEDMLAAELNHCFLPQALYVANDTEGVSVLAQSLGLILGHAVLVKAGRMHGLMSAAVTRMPTVQELSTAPPGLLFALAL